MNKFTKGKQAGVLSHWLAPVPNFSTSTQDFYSALQKELEEQAVPGLKISRIEFSEGGVLSDKRQYLRMTRERLVFDICAAPFGAHYFYSCRFAELPSNITLLSILIPIVTLFGIIFFSSRVLGFGTTIVVVPTFLLAVLVILRNIVALGLSDMDSWLVMQPVLGPLYERLFRKDTYYRQDTRLMYLTVVEGIIKRLVEEEMAAKGVKLLQQYEHAPILGELYRSSVRPIEKKKPGAWPLSTND